KDDVVERRRSRAELGRLLRRELGELHLERAVDPTRAILDRNQRLRRQRLELRREGAVPLRERLPVVQVRGEVLCQLALLALGAISRLPFFPDPLEPTIDMLAVRDDELEAERLEVRGWIRAVREAVEDGEQRIGLS